MFSVTGISFLEYLVCFVPLYLSVLCVKSLREISPEYRRLNPFATLRENHALRASVTGISFLEYLACFVPLYFSVLSVKPLRLCVKFPLAGVLQNIFQNKCGNILRLRNLSYI
jgi:hypothetical protein